MEKGRDPAEFVDSRGNNAPLAFWRNLIVLAVHHDGNDALSGDSRVLAGKIVHDIITNSGDCALSRFSVGPIA
jgi:hypothetical protein